MLTSNSNIFHITQSHSCLAYKYQLEEDRKNVV
jgi:hypothetical protein